MLRGSPRQSVRVHVRVGVHVWAVCLTLLLQPARRRRVRHRAACTHCCQTWRRRRRHSLPLVRSSSDFYIHMWRRALALGVLSVGASALQPVDPAAPAHPARPAKPAPPAWAAYVKPDAVEAIRKFFDGADAAKRLGGEKSLLNLAQGSLAQVGNSTAPQLLPLFAAPLAPPASATVAVWKNYHLTMVGFWYRVKFGFAIYKQLTHETGKWIDIAIKYFDMVANRYFSMHTFLTLFTALDSLKSFSWKDTKTYQAGYVSWVKMREAYSLMWWLYCQSTLDLLSIEELLGAIPADSKVKEWFVKWTPYAMAWAFMHWEVSTDLAKYGLLTDGAAWDAAKGSKLAALWYQKKFVLAVRSIVYAFLAPEGMPQQKMLASWVPWLGFGMSTDAMSIAYFNSAAAAPAKASASAEVEGDSAAEQKTLALAAAAAQQQKKAVEEAAQRAAS